MGIDKVEKYECVEMVCHRCKHKWIFAGKRLKDLEIYPVYAQCPRCRTSVKVNKKEEGGRK